MRDLANRLASRRSPAVVVLDDAEDAANVSRGDDGNARARTNLRSLTSLLRARRARDGLDRATRCDAESPNRVCVVRALEVRFVSERGGTSGTRADAERAGRAACEEECFAVGAVDARACARARVEDVGGCVERAREEATSSGRFGGYFEANARALAFNEREAFDHPVGAILCARAGDRTYGDVMASFEEQKQRLLRLPVFTRGGADPEVCFGKVLVWDARDGSTTLERAEELLKQVRQSGSWDCELLTINSDATGSFASGENWSEHAEKIISLAAAERAHEDSPGAEEGKYMSVEDVERAGAYVHTFVTNTLLPHIERKLFALSTQIYNTRKGLRNQFKSFWGRSTATPARTDAERGYRSPESQIRLAGDLAFMIGDYEMALANYKLVHADYKSQSAWKSLASSYEAMAHVYVMTSQARNKAEVKKDIDHVYEGAMSSLIKYETSGGSGDIHRLHVDMLKTRSAVEHAEALEAIGAFRDAHAPLVIASAFDGPDLRAALLLERAAFAFARCDPPMVRKFASYMVLAGARYVHAGAIAAATRCYAYALPVSNDDGWNAAREHLNTTLGRLVASQGYVKVALEFFRDAVEYCAYLPADAQRNRLEALQEYAEKYERETPAEQRDAQADELACPLPRVNVRSIHVTFADDRESGESSTDHGEEAWEAIERGGVIPQSLISGTSSTNWLNGGARKIEIDQTAVCASGEDVKVDVELTNPLRVPLEVRNLRLLWEFTSSSDQVSTNCEDSSKEGSLVNAKVENEVLDAESTQKIRLSITPYSSGVLRVRGVAWTIGGMDFVRGRRHFDVAAPRTRRGPQGEWLRDVPKHKRLIFNVCETMPRCEATLEGVPAHALDGALHRVELVISNVTQPMAKWIRVRLPKSLLQPMDTSQLAVNEPPIHRNASHEDFFRGEASMGGADDNLIDPDGAVYALPDWENLESGGSIRWPLWFHPRHAGRALVRVCVCYQPEPPAPKLLTHRTIRIFESVGVIASLSVKVSATPSPSHPLARVVRLSITSAREQTEVFNLGSVRMGSRKDQIMYELTPLVKDPSAPRLIHPGETIETLIKCSPTAGTKTTETLDFVGSIPAESAESLFAFHDTGKKHMRHSSRAFGDVLTNGLMVTWSTENGAIVGAQHIREVVELTRSTDSVRTVASQRSKVSWTIDHPSTIELDDDIPGGVTHSSVTLRARNDSNSALDIVFTAEATASDPANVENGGWALDGETTAWQARESFPPNESTRNRPIPLPPGKPFVWVGPVRRVAKNVAPGSVFEFPLAIACFAKGDHVLDGYTLSWSESNAPPQPPSPPTSPSTPLRARRESARFECVANPSEAAGAPHVFTVTGN